MSIQRSVRCCINIAVLSLSMAAAVHTYGQDQPSLASESQQFSGTSVTRTRAIVFEIDAQRNSVTLVQENGEPVDVVVDRSVGDVTSLKTGDAVAITYSRALLLRAVTTSPNGIRERIDRGFSTAQSVGSSLEVHRVEAVATVEKIDYSKRQLTLRGPTRTVTLEASSGGLLNGLNVGDSVRVDFVEATAIRISRDGVPLQ
ncbi:hypothetical protein PPMP20_31925 [Paraburkholderia phymatum]|uniref:Uncharacterized protein n=1 Tax=Paraburkholderia phymatum (strain DSM 17167 / CIP 108236 / LMG 21445 / STM815) TaxID=391038 RepID=B2JH37_PARP8|nr:hypothetical protein [Paraburkholderia phymatum]ACC70275.1 conserved hypothetical protein [Paraburkholderia phymatum STM815]